MFFTSKFSFVLHLEPQRSCNEFPTDGPLVSAGSIRVVSVSYLGTFFFAGCFRRWDRQVFAGSTFGGSVSRVI